MQVAIYHCTLVFFKVVTLKHVLSAISAHPAIQECAEVLRQRTLRKVSQWSDAHASGQEMNEQRTVWTEGMPAMHPGACFDNDIFARATQLKASTCRFESWHKHLLLHLHASLPALAL